MGILATGTSVEDIAFAVSLITVGSLVLVANVIVVAMFIRFRRRLLGKIKNILLFSMSVADLCVGCAGILGGIIFYFQSTGQASVTAYKIGGLLPLFGSFFMSMLSLGILTTDRLVSIKYAVRYTVVITKTRIIRLIIASWLTVSGIIAILGILFFTVSAWIELRVRALLLGILFIIGSIILSISNSYLYLAIRSRNKQRATKAVSTPVDKSAVDKKSQTSKNGTSSRNNSRVCIWMTTCFISCWFPVSIYYLIWINIGHAPLGRWMLAVCLSVASSNSLLNPIIYFLLRRDFRVYLRRLICGKSDNDDSTVKYLSNSGESQNRNAKAKEDKIFYMSSQKSGPLSSIRNYLNNNPRRESQFPLNSEIQVDTYASFSDIGASPSMDRHFKPRSVTD